MRSPNNEKWTIFDGSNDRGPLYILITDADWFDENKEQIHEWFDKNYPLAKPDNGDTFIGFPSKYAYNLWRREWN